MTYPFAEVVHDGSSWMVFVGGKALDGNPFKGISWKSKVEIINSAHEARVKEAVREAVAERDDRIADLERVLKDTCELMDKCAGRLNVFVAQHVGSGDEYFVFELNRLSVCAGALDAMSRKALSEIKSVLGKGE